MGRMEDGETVRLGTMERLRCERGEWVAPVTHSLVGGWLWCSVSGLPWCVQQRLCRGRGKRCSLRYRKEWGGQQDTEGLCAMIRSLVLRVTGRCVWAPCECECVKMRCV